MGMLGNLEISGGSSGGVSSHDLLDGSVHTDTVAQTVSRGSIIYGNSTPKWDELVISVANRVLLSNGTDASWGQADHGLALSGLTDDDHTQYALLAGRSGGQVFIGGTATTDDLVLQATSGAGTTGSWIFFKAGNNGAVTAAEINDLGQVGVGTTGIRTLGRPLTIYGTGSDIGYVVELGGSTSCYIQMIALGNSNQSAGFSLFQSANSVEWRVAVIGNGANALRLSTASLTVGWFTTTGNFLLDTVHTSDPGTGSKCLIFGDGTAPASMATNTTGLYGNDVSGTVELFAINEAGVSSQLTGNSGVYTPTRSAEANLDANVTMSEAQWMRVGNTITVSGRFTADPTTTLTATSFEITLPVASNIGAVEDCAGVAAAGGIASMAASISGSVANNTAVISWIATDVTSQAWAYTFSYQVI